VIVVAVIVSYQPTDFLRTEAKALGGQVQHIVVVDNASEAARLKSVEDLPIEVIRLPMNVGIAAAHNIGIQRARKLGATHVLLMDQDSLPERDMVARLLAAERALEEQGNKVGAVGPVYHDPRVGKSWPFFRMSRFGVRPHACGDAPYVRCDFLISSGTLIRVDVIDSVGLMKDAYFLEHVDTEWSLRARFVGYSLYGVCRARMDHHLGDTAVSVPLSGRRVQLYQPYRYYYLFRNALLLWREKHASLPWKINEVKRLVYRLVFFTLFVEPRLQRLKFMLLGLWDGLLGRSGPLQA